MMVTCEHCCEQMLDYLYGLLDPSESSAFATHIASCPTCTAAHAESQAMQGLLKQASLGSFPNATFVAPSEVVTPRRERSRWTRYAPHTLAAAVLLAVTVIALDTLPDLAPSGTRGSVAKVDPPMPKLPDSVRFPPLIQGREGADAGVRVALTTDKSLYQPGDALFFRSLTLDGKTMKPLVPGTELKLRYELRRRGRRNAAPRRRRERI
jgi:anti-sigma factor RsiW